MIKSEETTVDLNSYIEDLGDGLELVTNNVKEKEGFKIIEVRTTKLPDTKNRYKKNGNCFKYYKDLPIKEEKIQLHVKHQKFWDFTKNEEIKLNLNFVLPSHQITKRLANYTLALLCDRTYDNVAKITGIKSRTISSLIKEWYQQRSLNSDFSKVYVFQIQIRNDVTYIVLDANGDGIKITKNKYKVKEFLSFRDINEIYLPIDVDLIVNLHPETNAKIIIDYQEFVNYVNQTVFDTYKKIRDKEENKAKVRKTENPIKTSIKDERELFFQASSLLSESQIERLQDLKRQNHEFGNYYDVKEYLLSQRKTELLSVSKNNLMTSFNLQTIYDGPEIIKPTVINEAFTNPDILKLIGTIQLLSIYDIKLDYSNTAQNYKQYLLNDYRQMNKNLSDLQFLLRWNKDKSYK